jgi:hypothetical protein
VAAEEINEQYIRRQIVGPLRSEGILIVSNVNGYKIPSSKNDVITFFNLFSRTINPMLQRLKKSHEALYQATNGKLDMLAYEEFNTLKNCLNKYRNLVYLNLYQRPLMSPRCKIQKP